MQKPEFQAKVPERNGILVSGKTIPDVLNFFLQWAIALSFLLFL